VDLAGTLNRLQAAQQELLVAERMATVGRLSLRVAHEVRNPIAAIELNAEILQDIVRAHPGADMDEAGGLWPRSATRSTRWTRLPRSTWRSRAFPSRTSRRNRSTSSSRSWPRSCGPVATRQGLTIHVNTDPSVPMMEIDRGLLRQAVHNLVKNSMEALSRGGALTIESRCDGDAVEVIVSDTGNGIPPQVAQRLFEPFFTHEAAGHGPGAVPSRGRSSRSTAASCRGATDRRAGATFVVAPAHNAAGVQCLIRPRCWSPTTIRACASPSSAP